MKTAVLPILLLTALHASANEIRHEVERSSELERELAYQLTVRDKHDDWRTQGLDKVFPIKGEAPEYVVRFDTTTTGRLKDLFGLSLTLTDGAGILVSVPLETQSIFTERSAQLKAKALGLVGEAAAVREVSVQFMLKKELVPGAVLLIRCGSGASEVSYAIQLAEYVADPIVPAR